MAYDDKRLTGPGLLRDAAGKAVRGKTVAKAVDAAWAALHAEGIGNEWPKKPAMMSALKGWAEQEEFHGWYGSLPEVIRRRYKTPDEVAGSLRRAAQGGGICGSPISDEVQRSTAWVQ